MNFFKKIIYKLIENDVEDLIDEAIREKISPPEGFAPYRLRTIHQVTSNESFGIEIERFNLEGKTLKINKEDIIVDGVVTHKYTSLFKPEDNVVIIINGDVNTVDSYENIFVYGDAFKSVDAGGDVVIGGNLNGDINCSESIVIQGNHVGNIEADESVTIEGSNEGNIEFANQVNIKGPYRGQICNSDNVYIV